MDNLVSQDKVPSCWVSTKTFNICVSFDPTIFFTIFVFTSASLDHRI